MVLFLVSSTSTGLNLNIRRRSDERHGDLLVASRTVQWTGRKTPKTRVKCGRLDARCYFTSENYCCALPSLITDSLFQGCADRAPLTFEKSSPVVRTENLNNTIVNCLLRLQDYLVISRDLHSMQASFSKSPAPAPTTRLAMPHPGPAALRTPHIQYIT